MIGKRPAEREKTAAACCCGDDVVPATRTLWHTPVPTYFSSAQRPPPRYAHAHPCKATDTRTGMHACMLLLAGAAVYLSLRHLLPDTAG